MIRRLLLALFLFVTPVAAQTNSTTRLWSPVYPTAGSTVGFPSANVLRCASWVPTEGILFATSFSWYLMGGLGGGALCSVSIYNADGSVQIGTSGAVDCSATGAVSALGVPSFSLTGAQKVQVCICSNTSGGSYWGARPGDASAIEALQQAFPVPTLTTAANPCVAGVAPATTGTLTATNSDAPYVLLGTDTP